MIVIDKVHKIGRRGTLLELSHYRICTLGSFGRLIGIMSALQTFMLVVDHDKDEAKRIAQGVAQGTAAPHSHHAMTLIEVSYRCRRQENYLD